MADEEKGPAGKYQKLGAHSAAFCFFNILLFIFFLFKKEYYIKIYIFREERNTVRSGAG